MDALDGIRRAIADAVSALASAGARDEALGVFTPAGQGRFRVKRASMRPDGRVWRLGVFLLRPDGTLLATGHATRVADPKHPAHIANSIEERREQRAAAVRGGFAQGETVDFDARPIAIDEGLVDAATGPLFIRDGRALVRWSPGVADESAQPFDRYVAERVDLLVHPPQGA